MSMPFEQKKKIVVFGATGAVGLALTELLTKQDPTWEILAVSRSGPLASSPLANLPNVTMVKGDAEDKTRAIELCQGASIVYCTIGFPTYQAKYWAKHWPVVVDNLLEATSDTKLVFCDNLYAYGPGTNRSPSSDIVAVGFKTKPAIRAFLRKKLQARMDEKPSSLTVVGGADFFGPHVTDKGFLGDAFLGKMVDGQTPLAIASADNVHDFCYAPDFANALYVASINENAYGKFWICPHTIQNKTLRQIAGDVKPMIDNSSDSKDKKVAVTVLPSFAVRFIGFFDKYVGDGFVSEMREMLPWWNQNYTVDDSAFCETFGVSATPYDEALKESIAFFEKTHATDTSTKK